jgi:predicted RNA-binding Zn ribbon-like protein
MAGAGPPPPGIELIADFVNTIDLEDETDQIADRRALAEWLGGRELLPPGSSVSDADVRRAHELREAIRALIFANNGEPLDGGAIRTLNAAAEHAHLRVRFAAGGGSELVPEEAGVPGALARILGLTYTAMADESWPRLKACRQHSCRWAFYDQSKNRSRTWCSMKVCGNRTKARAYRERRRG